MAQTADAACTQLRVPPSPRIVDEDEADGSRRLRQSRSRREERSNRKTSFGGDTTCLCLGLSPSTAHQALQQLQTFEVPEKASFADFLSDLRIAEINVKDVELVTLDDSTMQVAVKASIHDQFATLADTIFAGRNPSAIPLGSAEELFDFLEDLTMSRTPATAATRLGSRKAGCVTVTGSFRHGSVFPVVSQNNKLSLDDA